MLRKVSGPLNSGARLSTRHRHWQRLGSHAAAGDAGKQGSVTASSLLPALASGEKQRHLQSQENTTNSRFVFYFRSTFIFLFSICCSFLLPRWQIYHGGPNVMSKEAALL